jgi:hypothetical protein
MNYMKFQMSMLQHLEHVIRMDPTRVTSKVSQKEGEKREDQDWDGWSTWRTIYGDSNGHVVQEDKNLQDSGAKE